MEPDRRMVNERLRDASVDESMRNGKWLLTSTLRQRIYRLLAMQVGLAALLTGFFFLLWRSDLGATIFAIAVTEAIFLVMGVAATSVPERYLRLTGRAIAPRNGLWTAFGDIRPDDISRGQEPTQKESPPDQ